MNNKESDQIWDDLGNIYEKWGIDSIPFSESASYLGVSKLREVFTGRREELKQVFTLFRGKDRKRLLVYGWIGIGKTAFILEILDTLKRKAPNTLTSYISLPANTDLATTALIALAREMPEDEWAQHFLNQMGLIPTNPPKDREIGGKMGAWGIGAEFKEKKININKPLLPELSFEDLLKRALEKHERVVIAIDDLDKQDPAQVRKLLLDAQGMLKSGAWFILTGHPVGLTRDILITERGLFDLALKLEPLEQDIMYQMLVNYLNSVRREKYPVEMPQGVKPFTPEAAKILCQRSSGVPRWLNRLGSYVLEKSSQLNAEVINPQVLEEGFIYTDQQVRGQLGLTDKDLMLINLVLEKGKLSDDNISLEELQKLKVQEFSEVVPVFDKLMQLDLIRRLPNTQSIEFTVTPLLLPSQDTGP